MSAAPPGDGPPEARRPERRPHGVRPPEVTLYGKAGCHLCDEARTAIEAVRARVGFSLLEVDVSLDPVLHRRYGERIPVVAIDGVEAFELGVDAEALEERLGTVQE